MKALWFRYKVWRGKATYGRQPGSVSMPLRGTLSARVIRANGDVEDLGVIATDLKGSIS